MISPDDALRMVLDNCQPLAGAEIVPVEQAVGRVLAEDILADRDVPPFDRVHMDGFACSQQQVAPQKWIPIGDVLFAGRAAPVSFDPETCLPVMTGAPMPSGADTVVPIEDCELERARVRFLRLPPAGKHIAPRGSDRLAGSTVLTAGTLVTPIAAAVLATFGRRQVALKRLPRVAIVSTGDEIVPADQNPGPFQIRDSNAASLAAQLRGGLCREITTSWAPDEPGALREVLETALRSELVVISGGVSLGTADLVPDVLEELGVERIFHEVAQKPGKPLWFGRTESALVFGAPGNPLATVLTCERYILPALAKMGSRSPETTAFQGSLTSPVRAKNDGRESFFFATAKAGSKGLFELTPLNRSGAADIFNTHQANAIFRLLPGEEKGAGDLVSFLMMGIRNG